MKSNNRMAQMLRELAAKKTALESSKTNESNESKETEETKETTLPVVDKETLLKTIQAQAQAQAQNISQKQQPKKLDAKQQLAADYARGMKSFCLIGAAGTGKTFTTIEVIKAAANAWGIDIENSKGSEILVCAFTRRAVRNSAKTLKAHGMDKFCKTIHKALEYMPEEEEYFDEYGNVKTRKPFKPQRTAERPLLDLRIVIVEEASMTDYKVLWRNLEAATPNAIYIFVGDLNQIPPVFGDPVLGHKLYEVPVVELTTVYRQAEASPIVQFQHEFTLKGKVPSETDLERYSKIQGINFVPYKKDIKDPYALSLATANYMFNLWKSGEYDPAQDTILVPFNKAFGSVNINEFLAQKLGEHRQAEVWEIKSGIETKYFAVGDFVMHEKEEYYITDIRPNPKYSGAVPRPPSVKMSRTGLQLGESGESIPLDLDAIEAGHDGFFDQLTSDEPPELGERAASAIITLRIADKESNWEIELSAGGEINKLDFGYCMTIHKSQGSQWRKVWLIQHRLHATMLSRELLYTGMTRAEEELTVFYSKPTAIGKRNGTIQRAIAKQRIPGLTWQQKAKYFFAKTEAAKGKED